MEKLVVINKNSKCNICKISTNNSLKYGPIYKLGKFKAHYYCVLLSNRLIQNGNDNDGILGFLLSDIQKELQRTSKVICVYCKKGTANIKCAAKCCKKSFHLPCGLSRGSLHQFANQFKSFCHLHRPFQCIPSKILQEAYKTDVICCICYEKVNVRNKIDSLWAPCCIKTWYHRSCIQKLAHSAGYFFKCAGCNDTKKFIKWMQKFGIFIPQQDASWELVPNAFEELLYRYNKCDADTCKCPDGRQKNDENSMWKIVLCQSCGSQGVHVGCGNLKLIDPEWECLSCQKITSNIKLPSGTTSESITLDEGSSQEERLPKLIGISHKKRRRGSEDLKGFILDKRKKIRTLSEENEIEDGDEIEIDVETVEEELISKEVSEPIDKEKNSLNSEVVDVKAKKKPEPSEVLAVLKPGPLSYKLSVIRQIYQVSPEIKTTKDLDEIDIIELSDSDDDLTALEGTSENDTYLISPELKKESEEKEVEVIDIDDDDDDGDHNEGEEKPLTRLTFSLTFNSENWFIEDETFILNDIARETDFCCSIFNETHTSQTDISPVKIKNTLHWYSEEEISVKKEKNRTKQSDFREVSDDEIVLIE